MQTESIITQGAVIVGSSAVLGGWIIWLIRLLLLVALGIEIKMLTVLYNIKRENDQNRRERNERPSQTNQQTSLPLQPPAGNLGKLGSADKKLGLPFGNLRPGVDVKRADTINLLAKMLNPLLKLFRCHKLINAANPPNDPKLSHGAKNRKREFATNFQTKEQPPLAPARC